MCYYPGVAMGVYANDVKVGRFRQSRPEFRMIFVLLLGHSLTTVLLLLTISLASLLTRWTSVQLEAFCFILSLFRLRLLGSTCGSRDVDWPAGMLSHPHCCTCCTGAANQNSGIPWSSHRAAKTVARWSIGVMELPDYSCRSHKVIHVEEDALQPIEKLDAALGVTKQPRSKLFDPVGSQWNRPNGSLPQARSFSGGPIEYRRLCS